ncbi:hypothetical protein V500_03082 [Pseudogymnoascus sp. VKM F-4518 (FW-2643)]|nr:hypothetical protein V500_03082 [Pseudogymnoascus sp. VKM F-4518 (FW-2643)]
MALTVADLLKRNKEFAASAHFQPMPFFSEFEELKIATPKIVILTCCDPRSSPESFFKLNPGEGVIVIRNVNGHAAPIINDILALDVLLGFTDILVVHHDDCGATHFTNAGVIEVLQTRMPAHQGLERIDFGAVTDIKESIRKDINIIRANPFIRKELADKTIGLHLDIKTGYLSPVDS